MASRKLLKAKINFKTYTKTQTNTIMLHFIQLFILSTRLFFYIFSFILSLIGLRFINIFKKYKTLIILYLFLFIQVVLILFQPSLQPPLPQLISKDEYQKTIQEKLDIKSLPTYQIPAEYDQIKQEIDKYLRSSAEAPKHRDALINLALLNLALNNHEKFEQHLEAAKQIDPNWQGFVKKSANNALE